MAGQPLKRTCLHALDKHEEEIFERLAAGAFVTDLCALYLAEPYAEAGQGEPNNYLFYTWLDAEEGRRARYERVRASAAEAVAEDSVKLLDEAREEGVSSSAEASIVRSQSSSRQWLASKLNRERFGEGASVEINMSLGELHLEALKAHGSMKDLPERREALEDGEPAEVIEGEWEEADDGEGQPGERTLGDGERLGELPDGG